jgi:hypothetical protein
MPEPLFALRHPGGEISQDSWQIWRSFKFFVALFSGSAKVAQKLALAQKI